MEIIAPRVVPTSFTGVEAGFSVFLVRSGLVEACFASDPEVSEEGFGPFNAFCSSFPKKVSGCFDSLVRWNFVFPFPLSLLLQPTQRSPDGSHPQDPVAVVALPHSSVVSHTDFAAP